MARQDFSASLGDLLARMEIDFNQASSAIAALWTKMCEPHRHYHTPIHILSNLATLHSEGIVIAWEEELAIWYHDSILDLQAPPGRNEERSATWLQKLLSEWSLENPRFFQSVESIRWTAHHLQEEVPEEHAKVMDIDLLGLSNAPPSFLRQSAAVRAEAKHLPAQDYLRSTIHFFEALLNRKTIYRTPALAKREAAARINLQQELERLQAELQRL